MKTKNFNILIITCLTVIAAGTVAFFSYSLYLINDSFAQQKTEFNAKMDELGARLDKMQDVIDQVNESAQLMQRQAAAYQKSQRTTQKLTKAVSILSKQTIYLDQNLTKIKTQTKNTAASVGSLEAKTKRWVNESVLTFSTYELSLKAMHDNLDPLLNSRLPRMQHEISDLKKGQEQSASFAKLMQTKVLPDIARRFKRLNEDLARQKDQVLDVITK